MNQYEQIRPIVFQKAPEVKQIRSNSLAIRSSPLKQQFDQSFDLKVNSTTNQANVPLKDINNHQRLQVSESCKNKNKENLVFGKNYSFNLDENQFLKQRINHLENQNTNYISENKKLAQVLDQQIQLNQSLQDQHQSKNQIIRKLEDEQKINKLPNNIELLQINDQLNLSKKMVNDLEEKLKIIIKENQKLSEVNDRFKYQDHQQKMEIEKYKSRCSILENKLKQTQDESKCLDLQRKIKKQNDQIALLQSEIFNVKQQLNQNNISFNQIEQEDKFQLQNIDKYQETIQELEYENKYLQQVIEIDQQKMNNLEEKLSLLTKENQRLTEIVKNRHKQ